MSSHYILQVLLRQAVFAFSPPAAPGEWVRGGGPRRPAGECRWLVVQSDAVCWRSRFPNSRPKSIAES